MVDETNQTLKETLSKWILETDCSWVDVFPMALLRLGMTPQSHGSSPYKIVYERPPPRIKEVLTNLPQVKGDEISQQMEQLGKVINQVTKVVQERVPFPLRNRFTNLCPGIRCGHGLETRLLGPILEGSIYCCSNWPDCSESWRCHSLDPPQESEESIPRRPGGRLVDYTKGPH